MFDFDGANIGLICPPLMTHRLGDVNTQWEGPLILPVYLFLTGRIGM